MDTRRREQLKSILAKPVILILAAVLLLQGPGVAFAEEDNGGAGPLAKVAAGTPYAADGSYDVQIPHVIVNQIYGGSDYGIGDVTTGNDQNAEVSDVVKTGDTAQIYLFAALMVAAIAIALISAYRYRSEKNR